jgi:putative oxidoreductase
MKYHKPQTWDYLLLVLRIWLGYRMFTAGYSSVIGILTSADERAFFQQWFGNELHFPIPVVMAFLAKGSEVLGGILVFLGLLTKKGAALIVFTMFIATVTCNLGKNFNIDGGFTISYILFASIFIFWGAGKFSLDNLFFNKTAGKPYHLQAEG